MLAHDVPLVGAGHYEDGVSLNAEVAFSPSLALFGGAMRPVLGGTFTTNQRTSWAYLDARWEWAGPLFFFGIGVGPSIHTDETDLRGRSRLVGRRNAGVVLEATACRRQPGRTSNGAVRRPAARAFC